MTAIIIIAAVALIAFWVIGIQNKLVKVDELCKNALKQINVQQVSRYDALKALIKLTREYASYEGETLEKVISARRITSSPSPSVEDINANERALQQTMADIKSYEENVRLSRMTFNDTVTKYNNQVRVFPASLVAGLLGFAQRDYLAEDTSKNEYPEI